jgi:hypothetical protein
MNCTECGAELQHITITVDPRTAALVFRTNCEHELSADDARAAWRAGVFTGPVPQITGAALIAAERARQVVEEGHTEDTDATLTAGELAWAAWALLDAAGAKHPVEQAPQVWPLARDRWPADKSLLRRYIIAGALIAAEIDRHLAAGETP